MYVISEPVSRTLAEFQLAGPYPTKGTMRVYSAIGDDGARNVKGTSRHAHIIVRLANGNMSVEMFRQG